MKNYLPKNLKRLRQINNLTQDEFGNLFKLPGNHFAKYESGINPPINLLISISSKFKISIDDIILTDLTKVRFPKPDKNLAKIHLKTSLLEHTLTENELLRQQIERLNESNIELINTIRMLKT